MSNPTKFTYKGMEALYWSVSGLRELTKNEPSYAKDQEKEGHAWFTVRHDDSDFTEPVSITPGIGIINRMGFIYAPKDFCEEEGIYFEDPLSPELEELRDELQEMESVS